MKRIGDKILNVSIYVDELLFNSDDKVLLNEFKCSMKREFDIQT